MMEKVSIKFWCCECGKKNVLHVKFYKYTRVNIYVYNTLEFFI